jgi:hypothetical protein
MRRIPQRRRERRERFCFVVNAELGYYPWCWSKHDDGRGVSPAGRRVCEVQLGPLPGTEGSANTGG